jgi:hypothetical protein
MNNILIAFIVGVVFGVSGVILYALFHHVYVRREQAGQSSATMEETETQGTEWGAQQQGSCVAAVDVQADGYSVEVCIWRSEPERGEEECCGGAHPSAPQPSVERAGEEAGQR